MFSICFIVHYYGYKKEEVLELTQSQISWFMEMATCIENPSLLKKYEKPKFENELQLEQYLLTKFKFI